MIAGNIHEALRQVNAIKTGLMAGERFIGYSGSMRAVAGTLALLGAVIMGLPAYPSSNHAHLVGWTVVMACAFTAHYAALFHWFLFNPDSNRDWRRLVPAADGLPPIFVGGVLSAVFIANGLFQLLFGMWMCLFGLTNVSSRRVMPKGSWPLGMYYVICGAACLFLPQITFTNPWPMGIVFFVGEILGSYLFHIHRRPEWRAKFNEAIRNRRHR